MTIITLPTTFLRRLSAMPRQISLREIDRELLRLSHPVHGNAQVIPIRTKSRRTISDWPQPPMGGAA